MIISKTPFRVSMFGGSTDYESFYSSYGSLLIGFGIDKYTYLSLRKTPRILNYKSRISYSQIEIVNNNRDIQHNGVRGVLEHLGIKYGIELDHLSDLPAQTGIGSSSSFIVGLLNSIYKLKKTPISRYDLAKEAIQVERFVLKEAGGIQDQIWASYGGLNSIHISKNGEFEVKPLPVSENFKRDFVDRSVLIYTGKTRQSFEIAKAHNSKSNDETKKEILRISEQAYEAFKSSDLDSVAHLLHLGWENKKKISPLVSPKNINDMYNELLANGVIGGKLLGTGGSGFIFGILKEGISKKNFSKRYSKKCVKFSFDEEGSQIINS